MHISIHEHVIVIVSYFTVDTKAHSSFLWLACFLHDSYSCAHKHKFTISLIYSIYLNVSHFKLSTHFQNLHHHEPRLLPPCISCLKHFQNFLGRPQWIKFGAFLGDQFAAGSVSLAAPLQMEMATLDNTLDSSQEVLMVPGPDVGECAVSCFCCCLFVCLLFPQPPPPPLAVSAWWWSIHSRWQVAFAGNCH